MWPLHFRFSQLWHGNVRMWPPALSLDLKPSQQHSSMTGWRGEDARGSETKSMQIEKVNFRFTVMCPLTKCPVQFHLHSMLGHKSLTYIHGPRGPGKVNQWQKPKQIETKIVIIRKRFPDICRSAVSRQNQLWQTASDFNLGHQPVYFSGTLNQ